MGLARASLLFARGVAYPSLLPSTYLARLDEWSATIQARSSLGDANLARAMNLASFLFDEMGLRGNEEDYYDPRNSFLNDVIDRRLGLPISLSVIFLEIASRIGLPAEGVGLPGHFVVAIRGPGLRLFLDPYHGGMLVTPDEMSRLVSEVTGYAGPLRAEWLVPMSTESILARMLLNLLSLSLQQQSWPQALAVVEHLHILQPDVPDYLRDMGLLHARNRSLRQAIHYLQEYVDRFPTAADSIAIQQTLMVLMDQIARLN
jgi:regulator of sirC expression with transglutaminase-like and TPR domain